MPVLAQGDTGKRATTKVFIGGIRLISEELWLSVSHVHPRISMKEQNVHCTLVMSNPDKSPTDVSSFIFTTTDKRDSH